MVSGRPLRRVRWRLETVWRLLRSLPDQLLDLLAGDSEGILGDLAARRTPQDVHATVTMRALVDAVVPETPALGRDLGPEHVPGGLAIDLEPFVRTYIDDGFQLGLPHVGPHGNLQLVDPISHILDFAALQLVDAEENIEPPSEDRPLRLLDPGDAPRHVVEDAAGLFTMLSRRDRLRAIGHLDDVELTVSPQPNELFEFDAGLVGQLTVGYTELIYYSEWQGYDEFEQPPEDRTHTNDPATVQSWRQTGYPGFSHGYSALRGYLGGADSTLGAGKTWSTLDGDNDESVEITLESGAFRENDYDTSDYTEPFPE